MSNTFATALAALSPDHSWPMDEASGAYLDEVGSLDSMVANQSGDLWRQAPGVIRNAPFEYGTWGANEANNRFIIGTSGDVPAATGWTTGTINVFFQQADAQDNGTTPFTPFSVGLEGGTGGTATLRLEVANDGSVRGIVGAAASGNRVYSTSATGLVVFGKPHMLSLVQRGDGTGIHVFLDGVDVTASTNIGGTGTLDSFGDLFSGGVAGQLTINGQQTAGIGGARAIVQRPAIWRNTALSDAQLLALFNSANLAGSARDYYEYVMENYVVPLHCKWWFPGWISPSNSKVPGPGTVGRGSTASDWNCPNIGTVNQAETDRITAYPNFKALIGGSNNSGLSDVAINGYTTGTVNLLLTFQEVSTTLTKHVIGIGGFSGTKMTITFQGTALGYWVSVTLGDNNISNVQGTNAYRQNYLAADGGVPLAGFVAGLFGMWTIVQDGANGLTMYRDGVEQTHMAPITTGTGFDEDSWWNDLSVSSDVFALGFPGGISTNGFINNDINDVMILPGHALDAAGVLELWDAVNGIFPADPSPAPAGGFNDTLTKTGNTGDINGPGPDHYWRLNAESGFPPDVGISTVIGTVIATGGDPAFDVQGPLILDPSNAAIFFDGVGDYFEVGVDGIAGELVTDAIGTVGFFISQKDLLSDNIAYSQSNDAATAFINFGVNNGFLELTVQTSAGNSAIYTSSIQITDFDFIFGVVTNDGSEYIWYVEGVADPGAALTVVGTGAEGDWFDSATWTRSAIAARADSVFTTETDARFSELFIYDEVLSAAQIGALFSAASADGIAGSANTNGLLSFDDCRFPNGGLASVRMVNPRDDFTLALQVNRSRFLGGSEAAGTAGVLVSGAVNAQVNGSVFDLQAVATTGRTAIKGTTADPTVAPTTLYSLIVTDNTFEGMGGNSGPAVFLESGYGATIKANRFFSTLGSAIGWRADAQNVSVLRNLIDGVIAGSAGIIVQNGLNTAVGRNWQILGNSIIDVLVGRGISIEGYNSSQAERARHILIARNKIANAAAESIYVAQVRDTRVSDNYINGGTQGIELTTLQNMIAVAGNRIEGHSAEAIYINDQNIAELMLLSNLIVGDLANDGILIDGISTLQMLDNEMVNVANGLQLGNVTIGGKIFANKMINVTTPLDLVAATTQTGLEIGPNIWSSLGDAQVLTVAANAVEVLANYHELTSVGAVDLNTIGGEPRQGRKLTLRVATGSAIITAKDAADDMNLAGDFAMDPGDMLVLTQNAAGTWDERSRSNNG